MNLTFDIFAVRMRRTGFTVILVWLLGAMQLAAADLESGFGQANKLYEEGRYPEAAAAYDQLLQGGIGSVALYYNRGNALLKMGQLGRAIASYRLAQRLAPRDPEVRSNLQFARTQARGGSPYAADRWERWLSLLSLNEWALLGAASLWSLFGGLALLQARPQFGAKLRGWLLADGALAVLLGFCLLSAYRNDDLDSLAIIVAGEAEVRNGPLDESQPAYRVRDGVELTILDRKDGWLEVVDSAQRQGWVRQDQVLVMSSRTKS